MSDRPSPLARHAARAAALLVVAGAYAMTRLPTLAAPERARLADRFSFSRTPLPAAPGAGAGSLDRSRREVHPSLRTHVGWVSSVGAAVALLDLDGDGRPNDVCHVDPRTDDVIVAPAPGTGGRYAVFTLSAPAGPYDPGTVAPMGCIGGDFNEDGRADLVVYYWGRTPVAFLRRAVDAAPAADGYHAIPLVGGDDRWFTNAATSADLDGDGHVDLVFGNYFADDGRILDTEATSVEAMQDSMSRAFNGGRDRFMHWREASPATTGIEPHVVFADVPGVLDAPVGRGWTLAVGAADLDGDLLPELYLANDFGPDRLLHNRSRPGHIEFAPLTGRKTPMTPTSKVLGRDSFKGMGLDFGDVNGDGRLDIYVSNIAEEFALEESHFLFVSEGDPAVMLGGVAPYVDRSERLGVSRSGWGWDTRLADFDNDGILEAVQATGFIKGRIDRWPELHELAMSNDTLVKRPGSWPRLAEGDGLSGHQHNPFFVRAESGRYFDIARAVGLGDLQISRGIAVADVDDDGDLDLAVANQWETSYFYRNDTSSPNAFLGLDVQVTIAPGITRPAIGAHVTIRRPDGRTLVGQVDGGNGHSGVRSPRLHFGLGSTDAETPIAVELRLRTGDGVRRMRMSLPPGWHTVVFPAPGDES